MAFKISLSNDERVDFRCSGLSVGIEYRGRSVADVSSSISFSIGSVLLPNDLRAPSIPTSIPFVRAATVRRRRRVVRRSIAQETPSATAVPSGTSAGLGLGASSELTCCICMERQANVRLACCRNTSVCRTCVDAVANSHNKTCPLCRASLEVRGRRRLYSEI